MFYFKHEVVLTLTHATVLGFLLPFLFEFDAAFVDVAFVLFIFFLWRAKRYFPECGLHENIELLNSI